jgi:RNA polymerase sigma-70 factor, ECF subfamily
VSEGFSDADLVARLRGRIPGAFDEVYRRHHQRIWRFLHRLSGSTQAAEDLFQETWLAAARNAHRLRLDTQLLAWLYTIARNKHRNSIRFGMFESQRREAALAEPIPARAGPDDQADARAEVRKLVGCLARLPELHREVLILHSIEMLDTAEVAHVLGIREDTVRKRLSRARAELMRLLDTQIQGDMR